MVEVEITLKAFVVLPEGSTIAERGRGLILPNGDCLKPWVVLERNDEGDVSAADLDKMGIYLEDTAYQYEVEEV
jgi:hypothetical protein